MNTRRSSKRNIKLKDTSTSPLDSKITKWTEEEIESYLQCIRQHGHKNLKKLQELFPEKNLDSIKNFLRTAFDISLRLEKGHPNLDGWLRHCKATTDTPWKDCIQIARVIKYLSVDGLIEKHPTPRQCQGINFQEAYRLLYQALMGYPMQPVNEETSNFILSSLKELACEVRKEVVPSRNVAEFLKFKNTSSTAKEEANKNETNKSNEAHVQKPVKVYQRKKPKLSDGTDPTPSLKITVQANELSETQTGTKDYSLIINNKSNEGSSTVVHIPVPVKMGSANKVNENEQILIKSETYNPLKFPEKWLKEPLYVNLLLKNH